MGGNVRWSREMFFRSRRWGHAIRRVWDGKSFETWLSTGHSSCKGLGRTANCDWRMGCAISIVDVDCVSASPGGRENGKQIVLGLPIQYPSFFLGTSVFER